MPESPDVRLAQRLALAVPALLLGGAYLSQYRFGLYPCEMCWWQRYPHFVALAFALIATVAAPKRVWIALAALAVLVSGAIGAFHAGVEYHWWEGITGCAVTQTSATGADLLDSIMNQPVIRCDEPQWTLFGISLAGFNFLFSTLGGLTILWLLGRRRTAA